MICEDRAERWPVKDHRRLASGRVSSFVEDDVVTPSGETMARQYVTHPGAVAIVAWDDEDRIVVVDQYRHPVAHRLVEIPAGLLDHPSECPLAAAQRELAEEAELAADDWRVLTDIFTTPGGCAEGLRIFLARGLRPAPRPDGFVVEGEEAHMQAYRLARGELLDGIYAGRLSCPSLNAGVLALEAARLSGRLDGLRPADAPWPAREQLADRL
ncbi:MAG: NUDIX hydrolase [Propionibacteriaceae bacterium]|nr:NUDIX hydrolase [Propionibacteriaceae bacterium]